MMQSMMLMRVYVVLMVAVILQWVSAAEKEVYIKYEAKAWNQQRSIENYLYQEDLPALSELTACYRFEDRTPAEYQSTVLKPPVSIAVRGQNNALLFEHRPGTSKTSILLGESGSRYQVSGDAAKNKYWQGNYKHCFSWKAGGSFKWYVDKSKSGKVELIKEISVPSSSVPAGGTLVMLLDQDSVGGSFDINQVAIGKMSEVNMWDYEMTADEVVSLTCDDVGNLVNSESLRIGGSGEDWYETTSLEQYIFTAPMGSRDGNILMRQVPYKISDTVLSTATVSSDANCALLCMGNSSCHTVEVKQLAPGYGSCCTLYGGRDTKVYLDTSPAKGSAFYSSIVFPDTVPELPCFDKGCASKLSWGKLSGWHFTSL